MKQHSEKNTIKKVRVLGPIRPYTQAEISKTDSFTLGVKPPVRESGDLKGSAVLTLIGPCGEVTKECGIIANRHIHITKELREQYIKNFKNRFQNELNNVYIKNEDGTITKLEKKNDN